jgi:hypothetical protein
MQECGTYFMIMHNMIIESERDITVVNDQPLDHQGPLAQLAQVPTKFAAFFMHKKIHNIEFFILKL